MNSIDEWWRRQFKRHFELERSGVPAAQLTRRWAVLNRIAYVRSPHIGTELPEAVAHWLDDDDVRQKSKRYAASQVQDVEGWLNG